MPTDKAKTYADNKKVALHKKNVDKLKSKLNELGVPSQWILNAQPTQIGELQKLLKDALKVSKREEKMIQLGLLSNEEVTDSREPDADLLKSLGQMKTIEQKRLKYNNRKWEFNEAVIKACPEAIAKYGDLSFTLDVFRKSIDISKYSPTASDYKRAALAEEKESADELFGISGREMFAADQETEPKKSKPPPLPKSKPPPLPKSKPPPLPKTKKLKTKKPKTKPVELDSDDELENEIAALKTADSAAPVTKSKFRLLFLDHFGDALEEAASDDPAEERTGEICENFLQQCIGWKAIGSSSGIGRYARKNPRRALKEIRELYINGCHEFLDPEA